MQNRNKWDFYYEAGHINIAMPMYNLLEHSDNYSDAWGSFWQFKRDAIERDADLTADDNHISNNVSSFKYKSSLIRNRNRVKKAIPLKYLSNFWRSLEMLLINCKVELSLVWNENCMAWNENCVLSSEERNSVFATDAKLYVPIVTLSAENNAKLSKY